MPAKKRPNLIVSVMIPAETALSYWKSDMLPNEAVAALCRALDKSGAVERYIVEREYAEWVDEERQKPDARGWGACDLS
jgi:hypothetical protein